MLASMPKDEVPACACVFCVSSLCRSDFLECVCVHVCVRVCVCVLKCACM